MFRQQLSFGKLTKVFSLLAVSAMGLSSFAQEAQTSRTLTQPYKSETKEEFKPSIGVIAGFNDMAARSRDNTVEYGITAAFQPIVPFSAGVELTRLTAPSDETDDLNRTKLLVTHNYNFGGTIPVVKNSYVGVGLGPVFDEVDNRWDIEAGIAPTAGFDIPIAMNSADQTRYTLGANANYLWVTGSNPDSFSVNGQMKYWF